MAAAINRSQSTSQLALQSTGRTGSCQVPPGVVLWRGNAAALEARRRRSDLLQAKRMVVFDLPGGGEWVLRPDTSTGLVHALAGLEAAVDQHTGLCAAPPAIEAVWNSPPDCSAAGTTQSVASSREKRTWLARRIKSLFNPTAITDSSSEDSDSSDEAESVHNGREHVSMRGLRQWCRPVAVSEFVSADSPWLLDECLTTEWLLDHDDASGQRRLDIASAQRVVLLALLARSSALLSVCVGRREGSGGWWMPLGWDPTQHVYLERDESPRHLDTPSAATENSPGQRWRVRMSLAGGAGGRVCWVANSAVASPACGSSAMARLGVKRSLRSGSGSVWAAVAQLAFEPEIHAVVASWKPKAIWNDAYKPWLKEVWEEVCANQPMEEWLATREKAVIDYISSIQDHLVGHCDASLATLELLALI